jgi:yersiniabactin salicyl-AMP ligase
MITKRYDGVRENCDGWQNVTYAEKLNEWAQNYGQNTAIVEDEERYSYAQLESVSHNFAAKFYDIGVRRGERVLVQLQNGSPFVFCCFALGIIGAIPILVLPAHGQLIVSELIKQADPVAQVVSGQGSPGLLRIDENKLRAWALEPDMRCMDLPEEDRPRADDTAFLLLSGGTTGIPKLIPRTFGGYIYNNTLAAQRCGLGHESVFLAALPMAHNFTLGNPGVLGTFSAGGTVVICRYASPLEILDLIERERVTITGLVPTMVRMLIDARSINADNDITSLSHLLVGGAPLTPELATSITPALGCRLIQIYGVAEGLNCATTSDDPDDIVMNCQGRPFSVYDEMRIVDADDNDVEPGCSGELITRGPYTITSYYQPECAGEENFTEDGFYRTGDRAMITDEGNIRILGRVREVINRAGEKIDPSTVENCLALHPNICQCAVFGRPDKVLGQRICACIQLRDGNCSLAEIREFILAAGVSSLLVPDDLVCVQSWPMTAVGKTDKTRLAVLAEEKGLST